MSMPSNPTSSYGRVRNAVRAFVDAATAAVKLVIKAAVRHRLMKLTLPKAYVRLGNDVFSTGRFREDFAQLYEQANDDLQRIEALRRTSPADPSQTQALTNRVKDAVTRVGRACRGWAVKRRNSSTLMELGRTSYDRYGDRAGPVDLTAPIANLKHRTEILDQEIRELPEMHRHGILTPLRLVVITSTTLGCILLFSLWHGLSARLPSSPVANPSSQLESVTGTINDLDAKAIVDLVIPVTSSTYLEAGFKEYHFGDNAEMVNETASRNPIRSSEGRQRCVLDNGRLVVYSRTYLGDNKHYMDKLRELFGGGVGGEHHAG